MQPEAQPGSLEASMADDEDAPVTPEISAWIEQNLHGVFSSLPACHGRRAVELAGVKKWLAVTRKRY
jgi:hypothetical protein